MNKTEELKEIYSRFMTHVADAKTRMNNLFDEAKLRCTNEERLPFIDTFVTDTDAVFSAKANYVSNLQTKHENEIALVSQAFDVVSMLNDMRAINFLDVRRAKQIYELNTEEQLFVGQLNKYILEMEPVIKRFAK